VSANAFYRAAFLEPTTLSYGVINFLSAEPGRTADIPPVLLFPLEGQSDADGDGLPDLAEFVVGTDPANPDTDGDEVLNGTNPLDGLVATTGIIATADTPGTALDVCFSDNLAVVADSGAGISVFNVFNGMTPTLVAQVNTPGNAQSVACAGDLIAVADGVMGLAIIDISDLSAPRIAHQVLLRSPNSTARAVTVWGQVAYVGTEDFGEYGQVAAVDLTTGTVLGSTTPPLGWGRGSVRCRRHPCNVRACQISLRFRSGHRDIFPRRGSAPAAGQGKTRK
jgi:hypothetical protein